MRPLKTASMLMLPTLVAASCTRYVFRGAIKGTVMDAATYQPVAGVAATLVETGEPLHHGSTVTSPAGIFRFAEYAAAGSGLPALERPDPGPMPDSILFSKKGYETRKVAVTQLDDRDTTDVDTVLLRRVAPQDE